ncbi:MAG TPA: signal peptidase I [Clostridia bacterium]|nr:signal peptidase I [Clostridia bacterium]
MKNNFKGLAGLGQALAEWLKAFAGSIAILALILLFIQPTSVVNTSMLPNYREGDRLLVNSMSSPKRGDVVIFNSGLALSESRWQYLSRIQKIFLKPEDSMTLIKRVVALPGERFRLEDGQIYIDEVPLEESYIKGTTQGNLDIVLPADNYLVLGDNRENSLDSRDSTVGFVKKKDILGSVFFRYWPLNRIEYIGGSQ